MMKKMALLWSMFVLILPALAQSEQTNTIAFTNQVTLTFPESWVVYGTSGEILWAKVDEDITVKVRTYPIEVLEEAEVTSLEALVAYDAERFEMDLPDSDALTIVDGLATYEQTLVDGGKRTAILQLLDSGEGVRTFMYNADFTSLDTEVVAAIQADMAVVVDADAEASDSGFYTFADGSRLVFDSALDLNGEEDNQAGQMIAYLTYGDTYVDAFRYTQELLDGNNISDSVAGLQADALLNGYTVDEASIEVNDSGVARTSTTWTIDGEDYGMTVIVHVWPDGSGTLLRLMAQTAGELSDEDSTFILTSLRFEAAE